MDHARHLASVLGLHRDAVPVPPHGDEGVLQIAAQRAVHKGGQGGVYLITGQTDLAADVLQPRAGLVADLLLADDAAVNLARQIGEGLDLVKVDVQAVGGLVHCLVAAVGLCPAGGFQDLADAKELSGSQGSADLQALQGVAHRIAAGEGQAALLHDPCEGGLGLLLGGLYFIDVRVWLQGAAGPHASRAGRLGGEKVHHFVKFQFCQCLMIHDRFTCIPCFLSDFVALCRVLSVYPCAAG